MTDFIAWSLITPVAPSVTTDGIDGDDATFERQCVEQGLDSGNLVSLAPRALLAQTQAAARGKSADHMPCRVIPILGTTERFAFQCHLPTDNPDQATDPTAKALL